MQVLLTEFLARLADRDYEALAGADLRLRLPIRERVLNELLAATVVARHAAIHQLDVEIHAENLLRIGLVSVAIPLAPRLTFEVVVERQMARSPSPTVSLLLVKRGLTRWLALARPYVTNLLPPAVTWTDDALVVDIETILCERGLQQVIPLLEDAEFESERGILWVNLHLAR